MEVVLDIKNVPKVMNPTVDSVIVFNGKNWYLTAKENLLKDAYELIKEAKEVLDCIFSDSVNKPYIGPVLKKVS